MKVMEALKRIRFTISKKNIPNETDAEAFDVLAVYLKEVQEKTIKDNLLFAKLYMYLLGKLVCHYGDANAANKHISSILSQKTDNLIYILETELRAMEIRNVLPDPALDIPAKDIKAKLDQYPDITDQFLAAYDFWDNENVRSHINTQVNLSIQKFKNYD